MIKKLISSIFKILVLASFGIAQANAQSTTAGILPLAKTQFLDQNGKPLSSGKVYFYNPGTTTAKTTWQDINKATPNTNPVNLDAGGRALIWGDGTYRQQVFDSLNNLIWDQTTAGTGVGTGSGLVGDGVAVGTVLPWSGFVAPANYAFAYGQALSRTTYASLLSAVTLTTSITCTAGSPTISNIADTGSISVGAVLESACITGSPTVLSRTSNTVTLSSNSTITFTTTGQFFPYGDGDGANTFNVPDYRGVTLVGRCNMGNISCSILSSNYFSSNSNNTPESLGAIGGNQSHTLSVAELAAHTHANTLTDPGHSHNINSVLSGNTSTKVVVEGSGAAVSGVGGGGGFGPQTTWNIVSSQTGITLTNASVGSSIPFSIIQPSKTANFIIKILPDTNLSVSNISQLLPGVANQLAGTDGSGVWGNITVPTGLSVSGSALNFNIPALTTQVVPSPNNDYVILYNAASNTTQKVAVGSIASAATSGVSSYNGLTGALGGVNIQTTNYTIANTDCEQTVIITSASLLQLTLPAVAGFPTQCKVKFKNGSSSRGVKLSGFPTGLTSPNMLWPLQAGEVQILNGTWAITINPGRWKIPNNTTLELDVNNGNDTNDCLAIGTGNACKTLTQALRINDKDYFDRTGTSSYPISTLVVQLADNAAGGNCTSLCYSLVDIAYAAVGGEGRNSTLIQGNAATPSNVVIADAAAYGINVFRNSVEIQNLQFGQTNCALSPKANSGLSILEGGAVFLQGTVNFGCVNQQQIIVSPGGYFDSNARPINVVAGGSWFAYNDGGQLRLSGSSGSSTVTFSNSPVYSQQVFSGIRGFFTEAGATYVNGGTVTSTGGKLSCQGGWIETNGVTLPGTGSSTPGSGCTVY